MIADLKFAWRMLVKSPGFAAVTILTLALGIGANSAIFSVIDGVLLRPLPFPKPEQLTMVWGVTAQRPDERAVHSYLNFVDLRASNHTFARMACYTGAGAILGEGEDAVELSGVAITGDIFDVLQTRPLLGRGFNLEDDKPDAARVVVISYALWQRQFGGDKNIIGREISLGSRAYTVTGVMPRGWKFPIDRAAIDYVTPFVPLFSLVSPSDMNRRDASFLSVVGRLKPGVRVSEATADVQTIAAQLAKQYPEENAGRSERVFPLRDDLVRRVRPAMIVLLGAVTLVLLIACANVANLLLARSAAREREIAIRIALGASRGQLVRQLLIETCLLSIIGGAAGLLLAWWSVDALVALGPRNLPRLDNVSVDTRVVGFTLALSVLTSLAFGIVPALKTSRPDIEEALKDASRSSTGARNQKLRAAFVISQFALSLVLLAGAGLLIRSFTHVAGINPGFDPNRVSSFWVGLPKTRYGEEPQQVRFYEQLLTKLQAIPGAEGAAIIAPLPFSGNSRSSSFTVVGQPPPVLGTEPEAAHLGASGSYFATMKIPLKNGRTFNERDVKEAPPVCIVNEALARTHFPNGAIGQRIIVGAGPNHPEPEREIVGVVGNARHDSLTAAQDAEIYIPFQQEVRRSMDLVLRTTSAEPAGMDTAVRNAIHAVDSRLYVPKLTPMRELLSDTLAQSKFNVLLVGAFAGAAMILAAIGIYGVIAYSVAQRTREFGIRMALGAQRRDMMKMVLRHSMTMLAIGLAIGLVAALTATRLLQSMLFGVGVNDITTYASVIFLLAGASLLASYIPARRATKVDPVVALRYE